MKKIILIIFCIFIFTLHYYEFEEIKELEKSNITTIENENPNIYFSIQIDKIKLNQEIFSYQEKTVDTGIVYLKETDFENNFYILAAHSGNSKISFFKKLYKLKEKDLVILNINGKKEKYEVESIEYVPKIGTIKIKKEENTLYLTTCDRFNQKQQLVVKCVKSV